MPYKHIDPDPRHKGEEYYNIFVDAGFNDEDANFLARIKVQNDIDEIEANYRMRHSILKGQ